MNILLVSAYPNAKSFDAAIVKDIADNVPVKNNLKILDLYADDFQPVLYFDNDHPRRELKNDPEMAKYRDLFTWAKQIIFVFPIWWGGMPAILKGFVDRLIVAGFAYRYVDGHPTGLLTGRNAWIVTTYDSDNYAAHGEIDYGYVLKNQVLLMSGIRTTASFQLGNMKHTEAGKRESFLEKIKNAAQTLG